MDPQEQLSLWFFSLLLFAIVVAACGLCSCAPLRPRPTPEQMPEGRVMCKALCSSYGRNYRDYDYEGNCICE